MTPSEYKKLSSKNKIKKITDDLDDRGIKWAFDHKLSSVFGSPADKPSKTLKT